MNSDKANYRPTEIHLLENEAQTGDGLTNLSEHIESEMNITEQFGKGFLQPATSSITADLSHIEQLQLDSRNIYSCLSPLQHGNFSTGNNTSQPSSFTAGSNSEDIHLSFVTGSTNRIFRNSSTEKHDAPSETTMKQHNVNDSVAAVPSIDTNLMVNVSETEKMEKQARDKISEIPNVVKNIYQNGRNVSEIFGCEEEYAELVKKKIKLTLTEQEKQKLNSKNSNERRRTRNCINAKVSDRKKSARISYLRGAVSTAVLECKDLREENQRLREMLSAALWWDTPPQKPPPGNSSSGGYPDDDAGPGGSSSGNPSSSTINGISITNNSSAKGGSPSDKSSVPKTPSSESSCVSNSGRNDLSYLEKLHADSLAEESSEDDSSDYSESDDDMNDLDKHIHSGLIPCTLGTSETSTIRKESKVVVHQTVESSTPGSVFGYNATRLGRIRMIDMVKRNITLASRRKSIDNDDVHHLQCTEQGTGRAHKLKHDERLKRTRKEGEKEEGIAKLNEIQKKKRVNKLQSDAAGVRSSLDNITSRLKLFRVSCYAIMALSRMSRSGQ